MPAKTGKTRSSARKTAVRTTRVSKPKPAVKQQPAAPQSTPSNWLGIATLVVLGLLVILVGVWVLRSAPAAPAPAAAPATATLAATQPVIASATEPAATQPANTEAPAANATNADVPPAAPAAAGPTCQDGIATGNPKNKIDRTPVGKATLWTVQEASVKPGTGFSDYDRWVQITSPEGTTAEVFNLNMETIHEVQYCGTREAVIAYVSDVEHHVWAMRQSAADSSGKIPPAGEIPVVLVESSTGTVTFLVAPTAPSAPTLETIKSHIEVVQIQQ